MYVHNRFFGETGIAIMRFLYIKHHEFLLNTGQKITASIIVLLNHVLFIILQYLRVNSKSQLDVDLWQCMGRKIDDMFQADAILKFHLLFLLVCSISGRFFGKHMMLELKVSINQTELSKLLWGPFVNRSTKT